MDSNTIVRWILIAGLMYLGYHFFFEKKPGEAALQVTGEAYIDAPGFAPDVLDVQPGKPAPSPPPPGETCTIHGNRFEAELSSRGAGLTHFHLTDPRYAHDMPVIDQVRLGAVNNLLFIQRQQIKVSA